MIDHANFPWNDFGEYPELEKIDKAQPCPNATGQRHAVQDLSLGAHLQPDFGTCLTTESIAPGGAYETSWYALVSPLVPVYAQLGSAVRRAARRRRLLQPSRSQAS